eukprot:4258512-Alexandrium_andersonii.AAC.1
MPPGLSGALRGSLGPPGALQGSLELSGALRRSPGLSAPNGRRKPQEALLPPCAASVSYTHLRAHETSAHL